MTKLISDNWSCIKFELKNSFHLFYDANFFGGFFRIIEKGGENLFIPEGRNGIGIKLFLSGICRALTLLKKGETKQPLLLNQVSRTNTNFEWELVNFDRDLPHNELCISGSLLQADVEQSDQSLVISLEDFRRIPDTDTSFTHIKDFFQITMTQDSLSQFLIKEFERIIVSSFGKPTEEEKVNDCTPTLRNVSSGNQMGHFEERIATRRTIPEVDYYASYQHSEGTDGEEAFSDSCSMRNEYFGHTRR
ncbi:unnamed protein product [Cuscuta epithymum]|uniref:Uncharacterized protein n=1 Tax=Cuscuta epithymum TaxID=186058 RepID=A0AAV0C2F0_9ASTE|nr:unnamed protein product [Cuscuta epithymum]